MKIRKMEMPLPKIDSGDINKFEASGGLFLIVLFAISLFVDSHHEKVSLLIKAIVGIIGLFSLGFGLIKWRQRQNNLDRLLQLEVGEKERLLSATEEDKTIKRHKEFEENQAEANKQSPNPANKTSYEGTTNEQEYIQKHEKLESSIFSRLSTFSYPRYTPLFAQKQGIFVYDMILQSKDTTADDKIVEIKYAVNSLSDNYINHILQSLELMLSMYKRDVRSKARAVLIIVYKDDSWDNQKMRYKVLECATKYAGLTGLTVEFILESNIEKFNYNVFNA